MNGLYLTTGFFLHHGPHARALVKYAMLHAGQSFSLQTLRKAWGTDCPAVGNVRALAWRLAEQGVLQRQAAGVYCLDGALRIDPALRTAILTDAPL